MSPFATKSTCRQQSDCPIILTLEVMWCMWSTRNRHVNFFSLILVIYLMEHTCRGDWKRFDYLTAHNRDHPFLCPPPPNTPPTNSDAENSRSASFDWHNFIWTGIKDKILLNSLLFGQALFFLILDFWPTYLHRLWIASLPKRPDPSAPCSGVRPSYTIPIASKEG